MGAIGDQAAKEVFGALVVAAEDLLARSTAEAPIEEGTLRASGAVAYEVDGVRFEGTGGAGAALEALVLAVAHTGRADISAEVSFNTPYAARQHEETTWVHPKDGKAKYLEDPLKAQAGRYEAVLAAAMARATYGAGRLVGREGAFGFGGPG